MWIEECRERWIEEFESKGFAAILWQGLDALGIGLWVYLCRPVRRYIEDYYWYRRGQIRLSRLLVQLIIHKNFIINSPL